MAIPTDEDIADRSKSDIFTKLFALVQSGWLIVSSIARVYNGYAITELELATMAFIVCALVMYFFWWHKPFGIEQRWTMIWSVQPGNTSNNRRRYLEDRRSPDLAWDDFIDLVLDNDLMKADLTDDHVSSYYPTLALYLSGMVFSAVHVAAWNWEFPSRPIQLLWRTSTVAAFGASFLPSVTAFLGFLAGQTSSYRIDSVLGRIFYGLGYGGLAIYVVARLVILFLAFYCFVAMPASVYEKVEWTGYIPHFS
jgi:hypothetical protein